MVIEEVILEYLNEALADIPCYTSVPKEGNMFVVIEKVGATYEDYISNPTIAVQSYAHSMYEAAQLNELIKETLPYIIYETDISKAKCESDYHYPDLDRKKERYQAIFSIVY